MDVTGLPPATAAQVVEALLREVTADDHVLLAGCGGPMRDHRIQSWSGSTPSLADETSGAEHDVLVLVDAARVLLAPSGWLDDDLAGSPDPRCVARRGGTRSPSALVVERSALLRLLGRVDPVVAEGGAVSVQARELVVVLLCEDLESSAATLLPVTDWAASRPDVTTSFVLVARDPGAVMPLYDALRGEVLLIGSSAAEEDALVAGADEAEDCGVALLVAGEHVDTGRLDALADAGEHQVVRVGRPVPAGVHVAAGSRATLVLVVRDQRDTTLDLLRRIESTQSLNETEFDLVVVDDGSTDSTPELLAQVGGDVRLLTNLVPGQGATAASVAASATTEFVALLDVTADLAGDWLDSLVHALQARPDLSEVSAGPAGSCRLLRTPTRLQTPPAATAVTPAPLPVVTAPCPVPRIVLVPHAYGPSTRGGVQTHVAGLAAGLARLGADVTVLHPHRDPQRPDYEVTRTMVGGIPVVAVNRPVNLWHQEHGDEGFERLFAEVLTELRTDVVHFHHLCDGLSPSLIDVAAELGVRTVLTLHDAFTTCMKGHAVGPDGRPCAGAESTRKCVACFSRGDDRVLVQVTQSAERRQATMQRALERADVVTAPSEYLARLTHRAPWVDGDRVEVRRLGLDVRDLQLPGASARPHRTSGGRLHVGVMGNVERHPSGTDTKGGLLVHAAAEALPDVTFHVHGRTDREFTALLAQDQNVVLHGEYAAEDRSRLLGALHCLVVASPVENYSTVVREALHLGVPVVSSDGGGLPELVSDGVNGLLFPATDAAGLVAALRRLVVDEDLRARLARAGSSVLSTDDEAAAWAQTYRDLVSPAEAPRGGGTALTVVVSPSGGWSRVPLVLDALEMQSLGADRFAVLVRDDGSLGTPPAAVTQVRPFRVRLVTASGDEAEAQLLDAVETPLVLVLGDDAVPGADVLARHLAGHDLHPEPTAAVSSPLGTAPDLLAGSATDVARLAPLTPPAPGSWDVGEAPWWAARATGTSFKRTLLARLPRQDRGTGLRLAHQLRELGLSVWFDPRAQLLAVRPSSIEDLLLRQADEGAQEWSLLGDGREVGLARDLALDALDERRAAVHSQLDMARAVVAELREHPRPVLRASTLTTPDGRTHGGLDLFEESLALMAESERLAGAARARDAATRRQLVTRMA